jgi:hypothetical protein
VTQETKLADIQWTCRNTLSQGQGRYYAAFPLVKARLETPCRLGVSVPFGGASTISAIKRFDLLQCRTGRVSQKSTVYKHARTWKKPDSWRLESRKRTSYSNVQILSHLVTFMTKLSRYTSATLSVPGASSDGGDRGGFFVSRSLCTLRRVAWLTRHISRSQATTRYPPTIAKSAHVSSVLLSLCKPRVVRKTSPGQNWMSALLDRM